MNPALHVLLVEANKKIQNLVDNYKFASAELRLDKEYHKIQDQLSDVPKLRSWRTQWIERINKLRVKEYGPTLGEKTI